MSAQPDYLDSNALQLPLQEAARHIGMALLHLRGGRAQAAEHLLIAAQQAVLLADLATLDLRPEPIARSGRPRKNEI